MIPAEPLLPEDRPFAIILGAGPAGLSAAYELIRHGVRSRVLEASSMIGGLSRTENYKGFRFDIGGHRFFTRVNVVEQMWRDILATELLVRPRLSRIFYRGRLFRYPLEPLETLRQLGVLEAGLCIASYLKVKLLPRPEEPNLEDWFIQRFGRRLYRMFFQTYTEKVWGVPCRSIASDWAAQRVRGLSVKTLATQTFGKWTGSRQARLKTLVEEFSYPRLGPGQMWEQTARFLRDRGTEVRINSLVSRVHWEPGKVLAVETSDGLHDAEHFISTMPIRDLIQSMTPAAPGEVERAANSLNYRDFITVAVIIQARELFSDNWIYVHDPHVKVGRIQNYKNWSPDMVPDDSMTCLGMEYFCFENDDLWNSSDEALKARATAELVRLGLARPEQIVDAAVLRVPKAYPVYDSTYRDHLATIRGFLEEQLPNLHLIGRNGMHRYNNQDHSMLTGMLAARNILGLAQHDLWSVNADDNYHEDGFRLTDQEVLNMESSQPAVPAAAASDAK